MRLKVKRRDVVLLALLGLGAVFVLWPRDPDAVPAAQARARAGAPLPPVPRIDLARTAAEPPDVEIGRRDLFAYGPMRTAVEADPGLDAAPTPPPPPPMERPPAADPAARLASGSGEASLPPLNLKFIGSVGNARGVKVAVLVTERNEVLTGQAGEVIANRYRIERIGIESVDLADVGTGQSRRIPLKGN